MTTLPYIAFLLALAFAIFFPVYWSFARWRVVTLAISGTDADGDPIWLATVHRRRLFRSPVSDQWASDGVGWLNLRTAEYASSNWAGGEAVAAELNQARWRFEDRQRGELLKAAIGGGK